MAKKMGIEGEGTKIIPSFILYLVIAWLLDKSYHASYIIANDEVIIRPLVIIFASVGLIFWLWPVALLLVNFPKGKLIITGPYALPSSQIKNHTMRFTNL